MHVNLFPAGLEPIDEFPAAVAAEVFFVPGIATQEVHLITTDHAEVDDIFRV